MQSILRLIFILVIIPGKILAQVHPYENAMLNYRIVGFHFPAEKKFDNCTLEIAQGDFNDEVSFRKNVIITKECTNDRVIEEVPFFGTSYTWRVTYKYRKPTKSKYFHFTTGVSAEIDTSNRRLRVTVNPGIRGDKYVFIDNSKVLYDMEGNAVWYLPVIDETINEKCTPRDLKLTPQGTLTMIILNYAYEISYDGKILWKAPVKNALNPDSIEHYHHEFTRLANGHYMIMATDPGLAIGNTQPQGTAQPLQSIPRPHSANRKWEEGKLLEFDEQGKLVWFWKVSKYFFGSDLVNRKTRDSESDMDLHDNSFYFDEQNKAIYISFRNVNRILKIRYPDGAVLGEYGEKYTQDTITRGRIFCGQHCIKRAESGNLYLFNNNTCNRDERPKVVVFKEFKDKSDSVEIVWEYECTNEGIVPGKAINARSISGGSVEELKDGSILVCTGSPNSTVFIVNKDKKVLWSALPEMRTREQWRSAPIYRASIVDGRTELERLIWGGQK